MRKILLWILISVLSVSCVGVQPVAFAAGSLTGWTFEKDDTIDDTECKWELDSTESYSGSSSLRISYYVPYSGNNENLQAKHRVSKMQRGKTYEFGAAVKAENASAVVVHLSWNATSDLLLLGETFDWQKLSYRCTWDSDITSPIFTIDISDYTKNLWIDDCFVKEVLEDGSLGPNLITNGNFDDIADVVNTETNVGEYQALYERLIEEDSFTNNDIKKILGAFKFAPVYKAQNIIIDGKLDEWNAYPPIALPTRADQYHVYTYNIALDNTAVCRYAYDDENFYLAVEVEDNIHVADTTKDKYWMGDSVQIALCDTGVIFEDEIGFTHADDGSYKFTANLSDEKLDMIELKTARRGTKTYYEAKIPWGVRYGADEELPEGFLFDIIVNDNDGMGRVYCLELAPGIAEGKNSAEFPYLKFLGDAGSWYSWTSVDSEMTIGEERYVDVYIVNETEEKEFTVSIPEISVNDTVKVPAQSGVRKEYPLNFTEDGEKTLNITTSDGTVSYDSVEEVRVKPSLASFDGMLVNVRNAVVELEDLITKCEDNGITPDYEKVNYETVKLFETFLPKDIEQEMFDLVQYEYTEIMKLYNEAKNNMSAYLAGTKDPLPVTKYVTSDVIIDGSMLYADAETEGELEEKRPTFFVGYLQPQTTVDGLGEVGTNYIQHSIGSWTTVKPHWTRDTNFEANTVDTDAPFNSIVNMMKDASDKNIAVDMLIAPHYVSDWFTQIYPDSRGKATEGTLVQMNYNPSFPQYRELMRKHIESFFAQIKDISSLKSVCLHNEPANNCNYDFYKGYFAQYLTERYHADINELNQVYGTQYKDFYEVPMVCKQNESVQFYDYMCFNDMVFADFHEFLATEVKKHRPDVAVHIKMMPMGYASDTSSWRWFLEFGTNHELFAKFCDLNGNDAQGYVKNASMPLIQKFQFYDMQRGMKDVPCANTEDHMIPDRNTEWIKEHRAHVDADIWNGAIHGRGMSAIWLWRRQYDPNSTSYGSIMFRPDCVAQVGKTTYDLNRLAYEVEALVKEKENVAILYSLSSRVMNIEYMNAVNKVWKNSLFNGQKVEFVTEEQIEKANDYPMLFLPNANNVSAETLQGIKKYIDNGGKVYMMGEDCLKYDERKQLNDIKTVEYIKSHSTFIPTTPDGSEIVSPTDSDMMKFLADAFEEAGIDRVKVMDAETGEPVRNVEITYAEYNGSMLINLLSHEYDVQKKVRITVDGKEIPAAMELRKMQPVGSEIILEPYLPILIRVGDGDMTNIAMTIDSASMIVNGQEKPVDPDSIQTTPKIVQDRTMIPVRALIETIGGIVDWNEETQTVTMTVNGKTLKMTIGSDVAKFGDSELLLDVAPLVINGRTMFPARFIVETFGGGISWNSNTREVQMSFYK